MINVTTCYGYGRHSTSKQTGKNTEGDQKDRCFQYWKEQLQPHGIEWGGWFYDRAKSGSSRWDERDFGRSLALRMRPKDWLITDHNDRLFRNNHDAWYWHEKFSERQIHVRMLNILGTENLEFPEANMVKGQAYLAAQYQRDNCSRKEIKRVRGCKEKGKPWSASAPPGWKRKFVSGEWVFRSNDHERAVIAFMHTLWEEGMNMGRIAQWWCSEKRKGRYDNKPMRSMSTAAIVRWCIRARIINYPQDIGNRDEFTKKWTAGELGKVPLNSP